MNKITVKNNCAFNNIYNLYFQDSKIFFILLKQPKVHSNRIKTRRYKEDQPIITQSKIKGKNKRKFKDQKDNENCNKKKPEKWKQKQNKDQQGSSKERKCKQIEN